ncbi:hypothetical protein WMF30_18335 [Sorangium sp. So ce134]
MVHRVVSGLGALLLAVLDPSIGAGLAAAAPIDGSSAEQVPIGTADSGGDDDDEEPDPADPQCGACAVYSVRDQTLYAFLSNERVAPDVRLDFYSQRRGLVGTYALQSEVSHGAGKMVYAVPGGPAQDVAEWGVMRWSDKTGAIYEMQIPLVNAWTGWSSLSIY